MSTLPPLTRDLQAACEFTPTMRTMRLRVPSDATIAEVRLEIAAGPDRAGYSVDDIRLSWNGADITPQVANALVHELQQMPAQSLEAAYHTGVRSWWSLVDHNDFGGSGAAAVNRALALNAAAIAARCSRLGDRSDSCYGNTHVVNFCFREIDVPSIRLSSVLAEWSQQHPGQPTLSLPAGGLLRASVAPPAGDPPGPSVTGNLRLTLTTQSRSPLDEVLIRLRNAMEGNNDLLKQLTTEILGPGGLAPGLASTQDALAAIQRQVEDANRITGDFNDISAVSKALAQIKAALHLP